MTQRHPIQNDEIMMVTTVTHNRMPVFENPAHAREAVGCLYRTQELHPFLLYAFVIMPDHVHLLLKVDAPYTVANLMRAYKSGLVFDLGMKKLWQPRFHIRMTENGVGPLARYIGLNPVRKGLCQLSEEYPWSSASGRWEVTPLCWW